MVRLTAQLINMSAQKHNPIRDWELDLRGYRIPVMENLGATLDQFDTIDLTDNDIRKLDKFPLLKRLKSILLSNNRIVRIADDLQENLPSLETLILTNNGLKELSDLDPLSTVPTLKYFSLLGNPVVTRRNYRFYVIHKIPSLRVLDFRRIKQKEREAANKMFKKKKAQAQQPQSIAPAAEANGAPAKTFTPGEKLPSSRLAAPGGRTKEDIERIKTAIKNSKSLEEVERLHQMLMSGHVPGAPVTQAKSDNRAAEKKQEEESEEEEDEEEEEEEEQTEDQAAGYTEETEEMDDD